LKRVDDLKRFVERRPGWGGLRMGGFYTIDSDYDPRKERL
jgi:hypothetical protein